jgi:4-amino-4-deoxy-L-arabinose transferase-like glycosyltransferase
VNARGPRFTDATDRADRVLRGALLLVGAFYALAYVCVALGRMTFPFELEWSEGSIVDHVQRVASGSQIYAPPSIEFVATMYTPGYYYVSGLFTLVFGDGFIALRLVSFLASLATFWLIFALVRRETSDRYAALIGACLFAATFRASGAWFDVGRPDSLCLALLLGFIYRIRFAASTRDFALAGGLLAASVLTKQSALLLGAPLLFYAWVVNRRGAVACIAACAGLVGVAAGMLQLTSAGWFSSYVTASTGVDHYKFWFDELLWPLPVACLGAIWLGLSRSGFSSDGRRGRLFYTLLAAGLVGASWFIGIQRHTAPNALMPPFAGLAILSGLALHAAFRSADHAGTSRARAIAGALGLVQFAFLVYNPWRQIPTAADAAAGRALIDTIRRIDGPVLVYDRGYLARLAGKPGHASRVPVLALSGEPARRVSAQIREAICRGDYAAVVLTSPAGFADELAYRYWPAVRVLPDEYVPRTVTFQQPNPNLLYRRRPPDDFPGVPGPCSNATPYSRGVR